MHSRYVHSQAAERSTRRHETGPRASRQRAARPASRHRRPLRLVCLRVFLFKQKHTICTLCYLSSFPRRSIFKMQSRCRMYHLLVS